MHAYDGDALSLVAFWQLEQEKAAPSCSRTRLDLLEFYTNWQLETTTTRATASDHEKCASATITTEINKHAKL